MDSQFEREIHVCGVHMYVCMLRSIIYLNNPLVITVWQQNSEKPSLTPCLAGSENKLRNVKHTTENVIKAAGREFRANRETVIVMKKTEKANRGLKRKMIRAGGAAARGLSAMQSHQNMEKCISYTPVTHFFFFFLDGCDLLLWTPTCTNIHKQLQIMFP